MTLPKPPGYWRQQADDLRSQAGQTHDIGFQRELLDIAERYDVLARRSEELLAASQGSQDP